MLQSHVIDIDGVIVDYPNCFYDWAIANLYPDHSRREFQKLYESMNLLTREEVKKRYRQSGAKASLPLLPGAKEFLQTEEKKLHLHHNVRIVSLDCSCP